ncbi:hypothetical protein PWT90_07287 [Aphanocladium album]|nr:hypothetical protein PWT90_07287 [Aphanocladium album]
MTTKLYLLMFCALMNSFFAVATTTETTTTTTTTDARDKEDTVEKTLREAFEKLKQAKEMAIEVETISMCEREPAAAADCRTLYPVQTGTAYDAEWDFENLYTVTWTGTDDAYPQQFQWETVHCGRLNKTMETGQRSFTFTFQELAAEYPKSQCNYTTDEFLKQGKATIHFLTVQQPMHPAFVLGYGKGVALWPVGSAEAFMDMKIPCTANSDRLEAQAEAQGEL